LAGSLEDPNRASTFNAKAEALSRGLLFAMPCLKRRCIRSGLTFYERAGPKSERQYRIPTKGKLLSMKAPQQKEWQGQDYESHKQFLPRFVSARSMTSASLRVAQVLRVHL
jgi:putative SOS response-associated peptidase YedK